MPDRRPDPEELLARVKQQESLQREGSLKCFLGFAPGVGKTYNMLQEAAARRAEGVDVVAGVVESHGRAETEALLAGFEVLSKRNVSYRGVTLHEFDLDAALARKPALLLVDELAHSNAPDSRHLKRWQDVSELLRAGIDVYTTLNIQHVESLNDIVAQITQIQVRETVPDAMLERADEIELIDVSVDELLKRLQEGKVYVPDFAANAVERFFRKGNLTALRELALRRTADRVDKQMREYRREHAIRSTWPARERLLVCVGPTPFSERLVRATSRMAEAMDAEWTALYVETPKSLDRAILDRDRVFLAFRLADRLGGKTAAVAGKHVAEEILEYARIHNVTKIIVGKPVRRHWRDWLGGSLVDELVWNCGDVDLFVTTGDEEQPPAPQTARPWRHAPWADYLWAAAGAAAATAVAWGLFPLVSEINLVMIYLLSVVAVALKFGRGPAVLATLLGTLAFDVFFIEPFYSLTVKDTEYLLTFAVMLLFGVLVSDLASRLRAQAEASRRRERETAALYDVSRELLGLEGAAAVLQAAAGQLSSIAQGMVIVMAPDKQGNLTVASGDACLAPAGGNERAVAAWVMQHGQPAGWGTGTLSGSHVLFLPLKASRITLGVIGVEPPPAMKSLDSDWLRSLEAACRQVSAALEREQLSLEVRESQVEIEAERTRNALLSAVSHDLRTPLTVIAGAASSILESATHELDARERALVQAIYEEADRLDLLVHNLLEISRLQSGKLALSMDWHILGEIVGAVLARLDLHLHGRRVNLDLPGDLPLVRCDALLLQQVFFNLIENAMKYAPGDAALEIAAVAEPGTVSVEVRDRGPGLPQDDAAYLFAPFQQGQSTNRGRGVGLGLAICKRIIEGHGGTIAAENRSGGGAVFRFTLPLGTAPQIDVPEDEVHAGT